MNCHIFVVWPDDYGHGHGRGHGLMILVMIQCRKTFQRFVELVAAKVRWMLGEVDHPRLLDHDGQGVSLQGPRMSMGGPAGSQEVNREV